MTDLAATGGVPGPGRIGRVAVGDILRRAARRFPDRIALTDGARQVTFTELELGPDGESDPHAAARTGTSRHRASRRSERKPN